MDERLIGSTILTAALILLACSGAVVLTRNTAESQHAMLRVVAIVIMVVLTLVQGARILAG